MPQWVDLIRRRVALQKAPNQNPFHFMNYETRGRAYTWRRFNSRIGIREPLKPNDRPRQDLVGQIGGDTTRTSRARYVALRARIRARVYACKHEGPVGLSFSSPDGRLKQNSIDSIRDGYAVALRAGRLALP
jgi:hypothetical protein